MQHPETGKRRTSTAAQALQAPISVPAPAAPGLLEPVSLVPASAPPTPATPVPSALPLHEIQDFDRKFSTAVGREPEVLWSPNPFTLGREPSIPPRPNQWAAVRKQAAAEGDANLLHTFLVICQPNQLPRWESLLYGVIKELHCSAMDNGISPPFTSLLETGELIQLGTTRLQANSTNYADEYTIHCQDVRVERAVHC